MQAGHFWIFLSRLVLACLQTGCEKSPQKSLKTACAFISLDLSSVSLGRQAFEGFIRETQEGALPLDRPMITPVGLTRSPLIRKVF